MGINFKEVAYLRGNDEVYKENFNQIDWSAHKSEASEINQMMEETKEVAENIETIISNAPIKKDKSLLKCSNSVLLKNGDIEVSHRATGDGTFEFLLTSKKENLTIKIDEDTIFAKTKLPLLGESFVGLYFEALKIQNKEYGIDQ